MKYIERTALEVKALMNKPGAHCVSTSRRLYLLVRQTKSGILSRQWVVRQQMGGKEQKCTLGNTATFTLAQAKQKAAELLAVPAHERREKITGIKKTEQIKEELPPPPAKYQKELEEVLEEFLDVVCSTQWKESRRKEESYRQTTRYRKMFRPILRRQIATITREDLEPLLAPYYQTSYITFKLAVNFCERFFVWCGEKGYRDKTQPLPIEKRIFNILYPTKNERKTNFARIDWQKMPELIRALKDEGGLVPKLFLFTILTAVRSVNSRGMTWGEIEGDLWTIPADKMKVSKNGQHLIPLSTQARALLESLPRQRCEFIFSYNGKTALTRASLADFRNRLDAKVPGLLLDHTNTTATGAPKRATLHGLARACFETWAIETGAADFRIIELVLHHTVSKYNGAYDNAKNLEEKRRLLQKWADFLYSAK